MKTPHSYSDLLSAHVLQSRALAIRARFKKSTRLASLCAALGITAFSVIAAKAATGSDNAGNYSGGWGTGTNGGTGFGAWTLVGNSYVGDPANAGSNLSGMATGGNAFALWAETPGLSKASRSFAAPLVAGDQFSIQLGYVWDNGFRGLDLVGSNGTIFNFNIGGAGMTWTGGGSYPPIAWTGVRELGAIVNLTFVRTLTGFLYQIQSPQDSSLNGSGAISASDVTGFAVYVGDAGGGAAADMRFNNMELSTTTVDVTPPTLGWAGGFSAWATAAIGATVTPAESDIVATGDSQNETLTTLISVEKYQGLGSVAVPSGIIDTSTDGLWKIVYTVTDPSGNAASLTRVVAVGTPTPGWRKMQGPATKTINSLGQETVYGRIWLYDASNGAGQVPNVVAELGISTTNTDPSTWDSSAWRSATFNTGFTGGDDEYQATVLGSEFSVGTYYYAYRFKVGDTSGAWSYAGVKADGTDGGPWSATEGGIGGPYINGTLVVNAARNVTFAVDMNVQIQLGNFTVGTDTVSVRGGMNNWGSGTLLQLTDSDSDGIYTGTFAIGGAEASTIEYKFYARDWEAIGSNRSLTLGANGVDEVLSVVFFGNNDNIGPVITLIGDSEINLNVGDAYTEAGATAVDAIDGSTNVTTSGSVDTSIAGTYSINYNSSDAAGNAGATVTRTIVVSEVVVDPLAAYLTSFGLSGDNALGAADPDGDGQSNDAEFAFGTDPTSGTSQQTRTVRETGTLKLIYLQRDSGITYTVKSFTDLATAFDSGGTVVTPVASNPQPAGLPSGYTQYEASLSTTSGKGFLRVKAVR